MGQDIFLARTEEQRQFRRSLTALIPTWNQRHLPTLGKLLPRRDPTPEPEPSVLLFYGPGGMGKTTLTLRLRTIAQSESPFKGQVNTLFLDWEKEQKLTVDLQVGHDHISPETVLRVLHKALAKTFGGNSFGDYDKTLKELTQAQEKVAKAMQGQPDNSLPDQVSKLGAKGVAFALRLNPVTSAAVSQAALETTLDTTFKVTAEGLSQTRQFVQKALTPQEYALYEQPHERLAEALGQSIARLSQRQPLVLLFDTYEIVDRPACDYTLRRVMQTSGDQALWVIGGRSNLADSGQRGKVYFRGYKGDFAENQIYAKELSEFGPDLIQQYFAQVAPSRPITEAQADAVTRFSLGIPFVIRQAAVMWRDGKPIEEIVAPTPAPALGSGVLAYDEVITVTSERFLVHCFGAPEHEADLEAIYALALMRRPDADLLRQMLDETDLETRLQSLKERYSFIWVEQLRLDEKLTQFLRAYLLTDLRRTSQPVQTLNDRAIAWLELQVEAKAQGIADTAEKLEEENLAETLLDLAHHQFWHSEDAGMRYFVQRFVEGWQYDRDWTRSLLEIAESFRPCLGPDSQKRVSRFEKVLDFDADSDTLDAVLRDLEKLKQRGWLAGGNQAEQDAILWIKKGQLAFRHGSYADALTCCLTAEKHLPAGFNQLRKDLAQGFYRISGKFIWPDDGDGTVYSAEGEQAITRALILEPSRSDCNYRFAIVCVLSDKLEKAIAACHQAIALDPKNAILHNGLGNMCWAQGRYEDAIAAFQQAIIIEPNRGTFNSLGWMYVVVEDYKNAQEALERAIEDADWANLFNYGLLWALQRNWATAQKNWQQGYQLCQQDDSLAAVKAFYWIALGNANKGLAELKTLLDQDLISMELKRPLLLVAQVMQRCPEFGETAKQAADMLENSLQGF
ncbi:MAG: hypothetical protein DCF32_20345 [Leptolyngbya sp.]|nr:MAG: hypothetical protein DCF32_20345 [Leptolyngbya sp.]